MAGRIFVAQHATRRVNGEFVSKYDLTPARVFGDEIIYLQPSGRTPLDMRQATDEISEKLSTFSDDDYILMIGSPTLIGLATAIAMDVNGGRANVLEWDREINAYRKIELDWNEYED